MNSKGYAYIYSAFTKNFIECFESLNRTHVDRKQHIGGDESTYHALRQRSQNLNQDRTINIVTKKAVVVNYGIIYL